MKVRGALHVPGDKSISHRALMLAALGRGRSRISRVLDSADVRSTAAALRALGAGVPGLAMELVVDGLGLRGLRRARAAEPATLDCGNSGTSARLLAGIVAGAGRTARFVGDASLSRRPMRRVAAPLELMGARVELPPHGGLPMTVHGAPLHPVVWENAKSSAQVKSAILLAALTGGVEATVHEPVRSRDHTERMLAARGIAVTETLHGVHIESAVELPAQDVVVPGDPSSAAFFAALAALAGGGELRLEKVCLNPTRTGFLDVLAAMGAAVETLDMEVRGGEPVGDLRVRPLALRGVQVGAAQVPSLIDELPLLACVAARAEGETVITGAEELRVKESDRITAVVANLRAVGAEAEELPDGMRIVGGHAPLRGAVRTHGDHRLAMAFGILGALPGNAIELDDPSCVEVSYPDFWDDLARVVAS